MQRGDSVHQLDFDASRPLTPLLQPENPRFRLARPGLQQFGSGQPEHISELDPSELPSYNTSLYRNVITQSRVVLGQRAHRVVHKKRKGRLERLLPFLTWVKAYSPWPDLVYDLFAGLVVSTILLPQGIVYALVAGLPPNVGTVHHPGGHGGVLFSSGPRTTW